MKKAYQFMKIAPVAIIFSLIVIVGGFVITIIQGGFNQGIDFVGGYNQQIQFAPVAFSLTYNGSGKVNTTIQSGILTLAITETDRNESLKFNFKDYASIELLTKELAKVNGISVKTVSGYNNSTTDRLIDTDYDIILNSADPVLSVNIKLENESEIFVTKDRITSALKAFGRFTIQSIGNPLEQKFVIKINNKDAKAVIAKDANTDSSQPATGSNDTNDVADEKADESTESASAQGLTKTAQDKIELKIREALEKSFESEALLFQKKDFIGSTFSKEISQGAIWSVVLAIILILVYVSFRFKIAYAAASVLALVHDCSIMLVLYGVFQIEFNAISIAALLTILGYSINDTIVVFDRIRENFNIIRDMDRRAIIDYSITQTLSRTIITSVTTFLAVISIFLVSTGVIKDFAFSLLIGIIAGTYSTIFIASAVVFYWMNADDKRKKLKLETKINKIKAETPKTDKSSVEITKQEKGGEVSAEGNQPLPRKKKKKR